LFSRDDVKVGDVDDEAIEKHCILREGNFEERHMHDELHHVDHAPEHLKGGSPTSLAIK
jgi:hypothetical protein